MGFNSKICIWKDLGLNRAQKYEITLHRDPYNISRYDVELLNICLLGKHLIFMKYPVIAPDIYSTIMNPKDLELNNMQWARYIFHLA